MTLPFERYLEGIAEVPSAWPRAALEAQAIAARSYALATTGWSGAQGETLATPICATTSCQIYRGMPLHGGDQLTVTTEPTGLALTAEDTAGRFGLNGRERPGTVSG